jgi:hypothetical protein
MEEREADLLSLTCLGSREKELEGIGDKVHLSMPPIDVLQLDSTS